MAKYIKPMIDVLYFDEDENIAVTLSANIEASPLPGTTNGQYSAYLLNQDLYKYEKTERTATVDVRDLQVRH